MKKKQIDFTLMAATVGHGVEIIFAKPSLCKVFRVYPLHEIYKELELETDIHQLLDRTCSFRKYGAWFYLPADKDMVMYALQYLFENLQVPAFLCEPAPNFGQDEDNKPIQQILN